MGGISLPRPSSWSGPVLKNLAQKEFFITLGERGRVCRGSQVTQPEKLSTWVTSSWL